MNLNKLRPKVVAMGFAVALSLVFGPLLYCAAFYIHEFGHIFFGTIGNLYFYQKIIIPHVINWINCCFIPVPQQTYNGIEPASGIFRLGGSLFIFITITLGSLYFYAKTKNQNKVYVFLFPLIFTIHELIGNALCGTDNLAGSQYSFCGWQVIKSIPFPYLLCIPILLLSYPYFKEKVCVWLKKR
jgi:hypothetical protein